MCHMYRFLYLEFYITVLQIHFYLNIHKTTILKMGMFISVMVPWLSLFISKGTLPKLSIFA
jgi:hypothetical protein